MLKRVRLNASTGSATIVTPLLLQPLIDAAGEGKDLTPVVDLIIRRLGFSSFLCGWASAPRPDRDSLLYAFTTLPTEWTTLYDKAHFIEIDPRIQSADDSSALIRWSAAEVRGKSKDLDEFLAQAARYGIRSGASFGWHDQEGNGVLVAYNSDKTSFPGDELRVIADSLYAFGHAFHEIFMRAVIEREMPSRLRGVALTRREVEAMEYAARGLTLQDIGPKMGISPRTVRFHIDAATTKLGALKREEAIALAVKGGLIRVLR